MFQPKNILVPTDFSPESDQALQIAMSIASRFRSRVFLLHVINDAVQQCVADYSIQGNIADRLLSESIIFSNEKLQEIISENTGKGNARIIYNVRRGQPGEEILLEAAERDADLIVIASHGKTGFKKYFIGSVAERVTKEAKCPVLLARSRGKKEV